MKLDKENITKVIKKAKTQLAQEKEVSPGFRAILELLFMIITLLVGRLGITSRNSGKPPSSDPNRKKEKKTNPSGRKPGGQVGRKGVQLSPTKHPDKVIFLKLDRRKLPRGDYHEVGFQSRQIVEIEISTLIKEYRAQTLEDANGKRYTASFPEGVTRPIQYGQSIKSHAVYMSQYQLIPYERTADYFANEMNLPLSVGSLYNFNQEAYTLLDAFEVLAKEQLTNAKVVHADETGINVNGKRLWLHNASNDKWTIFHPHLKRGVEAMDAIGILPKFKGVLVHDHWKPYYRYTQCFHALCNAHHLRELQWVIDHHDATWAKQLQAFLLELNESVTKTKHQMLSKKASDCLRKKYQSILKAGLEEMPLTAPPSEGKKKRGRIKKTKAQNLLARLAQFENDVLRFMENPDVPFTNNQGENDIRMTKVQQKISGCFKSIEGAKIFCRVRSYLLTSQKHGISPTDALKSLFKGHLPEKLLTQKTTLLL